VMTRARLRGKLAAAVNRTERHSPGAANGR